MKSFFISLFVFVLSSSLYATDLICKGETDTHQIQLQQTKDGVTATLKNIKPYKYTDAVTREDGKFKVRGHDVSIITIYDIDLPTLMLKSRLAVEFIAKMLFGRIEFDGEADMVHSYAYDLFKAAKCD